MKNNTEKELLLRLHDKVDSISEKIKEVEIIQSKHETNLLTHMKRSDLAETRMEFIENEVKPILQGLSFLKTVAKIAASISSLLYAISKFFR